MDWPSRVHYARGPHGFVAYQVAGDGPPTIVHVGSWGQTIEGFADTPAVAHYLRRLRSLGQVVLFDKRGTGLSDPLPRPWVPDSGFGPMLEESVADLVTVLDDLEVSRALVIGVWAGTAAAMAFAATHPERTAGLILVDPAAALLQSPDNPHGLPAATRAEWAELIRARWGTGLATALTPTIAADPDFQAWAARNERISCPRGVMASWWDHLDFDVRPMLPLIQAPTLVLRHHGHPACDPEQSRQVLDLVPRIEGPVDLDHPDLEVYGPQPEEFFEAIEGFVERAGGSRHVVPDSRIFAAVLFTDLVDSTRRATEMGDRHWRELLDVHDAVTERVVTRHGGRVVKRMGDGLLATFAAPGQAVACGRLLLGELSHLGLPARAAIHAGELERRGSDVSGIAVHIAARVLAEAGDGDVLVSRTVKDLLAGSDFVLTPLGARRLHGIDEPWELYRVARPAWDSSRRT